MGGGGGRRWGGGGRRWGREEVGGREEVVEGGEGGGGGGWGREEVVRWWWLILPTLSSVRDWSRDDVQTWLQQLNTGLHSLYCANFANHDITGIVGAGHWAWGGGGGGEGGHCTPLYLLSLFHPT